MKKLIIFIVVVAIILALGVFAANYWYNNAITSPNGADKSARVFEVVAGDNIEVIAANLVKSGILREKDAFLIYAKFNPDLVAKIQAGYFEIAAANTIEEIMVILQKAKDKEDVRVTIPEGLRYDEVAEIISNAFANEAEKKFIKERFEEIVKNPDASALAGSAKEFLNKFKPAGKSLEGYLYPDTYMFSKDATAEMVIEKMINTLSLRLSREDIYVIENSNYSFYDLLNIAAMIERESFAVSEDAMIADVIFKRLEKGVNGVKLLQIDATLLYPAKDWKANAFALKSVDNPYNTYMYPGLPPTPIANPGIDAIKAAIYPESNDYYYYIHDKTGKIHFAKTYGEHLNNVNKYL